MFFNGGGLNLHRIHVYQIWITLSGSFYNIAHASLRREHRMEFLVEIDVNLPPDFDAGKADELRKAEAARGVELYEAGTIRRVWRVPGRRAAVAIWEAPDATALHLALSSLPLFPWLDIQVRPLARHYIEDLIAQRTVAGTKKAGPA